MSLAGRALLSPSLLLPVLAEFSHPYFLIVGSTQVALKNIHFVFPSNLSLQVANGRRKWKCFRVRVTVNSRLVTCSIGCYIHQHLFVFVIM
jgi:hypothetical protein